MIKEIGEYTLKLLGFTLLLYAAHWYILYHFFTGVLYFPLWTIYLFNAVLVFLVYVLLRYYSSKSIKNVLNIFLGLTAAKMLLAVVFLLPIFIKKIEHVQLEVFNFFIPYFLFLFFEIFGLNKFLQKS